MPKTRTRRSTLFLLLCLLMAAPAQAQFSFISGIANDGTTTPSIDTSGADLIVCGAIHFGSFTSFTDSESNTWTLIQEDDYFDTGTLRTYYVVNPTTDAAHTFTLSATSPRVACAAFSGADDNPLDQSAAGSVQLNVSTIQPGSLTPSADNSLIVSTLYYESGGAVTINSSFTGVTPLNEFAGIAYKIQTTAGAENPTWTMTTSNSIVIAHQFSFFVDGAGGASGAPRLLLLGVGN